MNLWNWGLDLLPSTKDKYSFHVLDFLDKTLTKKGIKKITMKSVKMIKWNQIVAFFHYLRNEKKGPSSLNNYFKSLKSYFKPVGKFKGKFEEIRIGKIRTQVKPVSLTHSLLVRRRIYLRRKNGPICRRF